MFNGLVEGRVSKQLKEICLLDQTCYAEDGKQSVAKYLESVFKDLTITWDGFVLEVGEGMEKKQEDFVAEVAAQMLESKLYLYTD